MPGHSAISPLLADLASRLREWPGPVPPDHPAPPPGRPAPAPARDQPHRAAPSGPAAEAPASFLDDKTFDGWAMRVHEAQREANPVLRRFWEATSARPPATWRDIPPVPASAFKEVAIHAGAVEAVFRTSGTSAGAERRGEHHVASLELYRAAARGHYRAALLHGIESAMMVSLVPDPRERPDSSLGAMAGFLAGEPEVAQALWAFDLSHGVRAQLVREAVSVAERPVLLLATAFALAHLLDALGETNLPLPEGSRVMETGGFKGRAVQVGRRALYDRVARRLGVPPALVINEYGMTELLSQAYDGIAGHAPPLEARSHRFPPWARVQALDPASLRPLPPGETGLLAIFDLANAGSACHVLTEDVGCTDAEGGFRPRGRASGAEARGCSLAAESFVRAAGAAAHPTTSPA